MIFMNLLDALSSNYILKKKLKEKRKSKGSYTEESNAKQVCDVKGGS